jgi:hypothetical protein
MLSSWRFLFNRVAVCEWSSGGYLFVAAAELCAFGMRHRAAHLGRRLVLAQPFIDDLARETVLGPGQEFDLGDQLGPHPMHAA